MLSRPWRTRPRTVSTGWGLVELMVGLAMLGILSTLAWPSYESRLQRLRRMDGQTALMRLQQAEEQHRSRTAVYADRFGSEGLPLSPSSEAGHYRLSVDLDPGRADVAYRIRATATGRQSDDLPCRHLAIEVDAGLLRWRSGPDDGLDNDDDRNRRCWGPW
ncbi:type IV pilin protein [Leptothrix sp. BB-4]